MRGRLGDKVRLQHSIEAIQEIENYLNAVDYDQFMSNSMMRFACIKQLEIVGEASNHISDDIKSRFIEIKWAQIIGMRNIFVHQYFGVDYTLIWEIINNDLPALTIKMIEILDAIV